MTSYLRVAFVVITFAVTQAVIHDLSADDKQRLLDRHNEARAAEPASIMPNLTWSDDLAKLAQDWTDNCQFSHQPNKPWGENIAAKSASHTNNRAAIDYMVGLWMKEKEKNVGGTFEECCSQHHHECCHYTQVIWAETTEVGCGMTLCPTLTTSHGAMSNSAFLACYYNPAGNSPTSKCTWDWSPYVPQ